MPRKQPLTEPRPVPLSRVARDGSVFHDAEGLTPQQRAFCDAYLGAARRSATRAYEMSLLPGEVPVEPNRRAKDMMDKPQVQAYLQKRGRELAAVAEITQEQVILDLVELREMAMGRKPTPLARFHEGELVHGLARNVDFAGATRILDLLGRYLGMWTENVRVEGAGNTVVMLNLGGRTIDGEATRV